MLEKAQGMAVDEAFLDLEDAVAVDAKDAARRNVVAAARDGDWSGKTLAVRVNDWTTPWTHRDVVDIVTGAGDRIDTIVLPKADSPHHVAATDLLLTQVETAAGLPAKATEVKASTRVIGIAIHHYAMCMSRWLIRYRGF